MRDCFNDITSTAKQNNNGPVQFQTFNNLSDKKYTQKKYILYFVAYTSITTRGYIDDFVYKQEQTQTRWRNETKSNENGMANS